MRLKPVRWDAVARTVCLLRDGMVAPFGHLNGATYRNTWAPGSTLDYADI